MVVQVVLKVLPLVYERHVSCSRGQGLLIKLLGTDAEALAHTTVTVLQSRVESPAQRVLKYGGGSVRWGLVLLGAVQSAVRHELVKILIFVLLGKLSEVLEESVLLSQVRGYLVQIETHLSEFDLRFAQSFILGVLRVVQAMTMHLSLQTLHSGKLLGRIHLLPELVHD